MSVKIGRNDPCHCGSGSKYKKCCAPKDDEAERAARLVAEIAAKPETQTDSGSVDVKPAKPAVSGFRAAPGNRNAQFKPKATGFKAPSAVHRKAV